MVSLQHPLPLCGRRTARTPPGSPQRAPRDGPRLRSPALPGEGEACVSCAPRLRLAPSAEPPRQPSRATASADPRPRSPSGDAASSTRNGAPLGRRQGWRFRAFRDLRARRKQGRRLRERRLHSRGSDARAVSASVPLPPLRPRGPAPAPPAPPSNSWSRPCRTTRSSELPGSHTSLPPNLPVTRAPASPGARGAARSQRPEHAGSTLGCENRHPRPAGPLSQPGSPPPAAPPPPHVTRPRRGFR